MAYHERKDIVCIVCPVGCLLTLVKDESMKQGYHVEGNSCPRGAKYGIEEVTAPTRKLPTTIKIRGGILERLPVITSDPIPKELIFQAMDIINRTEVQAPIKMGDVIVKNLLDTGVNVIATRSMKREGN